MMKQVVIVGAGIAGLTLALILHARGIRAKVFESAVEIEPLGVGLNIQPYAVRVLEDLGLRTIIESQAVVPRDMIFFNRHGQKIHSVALGRYGGHSCPQISVHRPVIQLELLKAARARLGDNFLSLGHKFVSLRQNDREVEAIFLDRRAGDCLTTIKCDALVGADGVRSRVHHILFPDGPRLQHRNIHMWRGVTIGPRFLGGGSMIRVGLPSYGKLVAYPIKSSVNPKGDQLINWVAEVDSRLLAKMSEEELHDNHSFIRFFSSRVFDWLNLPRLLARAQGKILSLPMMDRDPMPCWRSGRVTLVGDAAHPMLPVGSNGAGQAILDAESLGKKLGAVSSVEEAMHSYELERREFTANIVLGDRSDLPDRLIKVVDDRTGGGPISNIREIVSDEEAAMLASPKYQDRSSSTRL